MRRACSAVERAQRYEQLATQGSTELRALYEGLAADQRRLADRHQAAARIQEAVADRLRDSQRRVESAVATGIAHAVADALGLAGVAVLLRSSSGANAAAAGSDDRALRVQDAELVLSEGPSHYVTRTGRPLAVEVAELRARWPLFAAAVEPLALQAIAAVPLRTGSATVGSLTVLDAAWPNREHGLADLATFGEALVDTVWEDLRENGGFLDDTSFMGGDWMASVHVAAGMMAALHHVSPADALALIRAHAYAEGIAVGDVAFAITQGSLRLLG